jgi:hypothetical protein
LGGETENIFDFLQNFVIDLGLFILLLFFFCPIDLQKKKRTKAKRVWEGGNEKYF